MFEVKKIKGSDKYQWTRHAQYKMQQYGLSPQRITRVIRNPERTEEGIVPKTIAVMQPASIKFKDGQKTWSQEIWAMYQTRGAGNSKSQSRALGINPKQIPNHNPEYSGQKLKIKNSEIEELFKNLKFKIKNSNLQIRIISAWRYPGVSPKNNPIPEEILSELADMD